MLQEEYHDLMRLLEESSKLETFSLEELMTKAALFFEQLKSEFLQASPDDRKEIAKMVQTLQVKLAELSKKTAEEAGVSEEELTAMGNDPRNFTPEQWKAIQKNKTQMYETAKGFSEEVEKKRQKGEIPLKKEGASKIRSKIKRARRKDWLKS